MKHITDRELFQKIYDEYYRKFSAKDTEYDVEIDLEKMAKELGVSYGALWGRFYFDINQRYNYKKDRHIFVPFAGENKDKCLIHFPMLYAALCRETERHDGFLIPIYVSVLAIITSLAISIISALI